jgi:hypothetical protein
MQRVRFYSTYELQSVAVLLFILLLALGLSLGLSVLERLAAARRLALHDWAVDLALSGLLVLGGALLCAWLPRLYADAVRIYGENVTSAPETALGPITRDDIEFVRQIEKIVPSSELVLLPGVAERVNREEIWNFAVASSRALPLYSNTPYCFFDYQGPAGCDAIEYQHRVCWAFDIPWLVEMKVHWAFVSKASLASGCVYHWKEISEKYFEERLRQGDRVLYHLKDDALAKAGTDPLLNLPLDEPATPGTKALGINGDIDLCGPDRFEGWVCDYGVDGPTTVGLELTSPSGKVVRELHIAALNREKEVGQACGGKGSTRHGFVLRPFSVRKGNYKVSVIAYDGRGKPAAVLGSECEAHVVY